jgi:hypothetical protein
MERIRGSAPFIPSVKLSYTFTFLMLANKNVVRKMIGIINGKIYFILYIPL